METIRVIRLIIEDQEDVIYGDDDVTTEMLNQFVVYVTELIRKQYNANELTYTCIKGEEKTLDEIVNKYLSPIFITIPGRPEVKTENKIDPRRLKNIYIYNNKDKLHIQRFARVKRIEEQFLTLEDIKNDNAHTTQLKYDKSAKNRPNLKLNVNKNEPESAVEDPSAAKNPLLNIHPISGSKTTSGTDSGTLKPQDAGARQQVVTETGKNMVGHGRRPSASNGANSDGKSEMKTYTMDEVKKHATTQDAWMVLNGKVYDVTKYIAYHPGGQVIMKGVGKDGTSLFNQYHSWVNANYILAKYQIGTLRR